MKRHRPRLFYRGRRKHHRLRCKALPEKQQLQLYRHIKLDPLHLVGALKLLEEELTHERLAAIAFSRCGYDIIDKRYENPSTSYDFKMKKGKNIYAVEIKRIDVEGGP